MTTQFHDALIDGITRWNANDLNAPHSQLDSALGDLTTEVEGLTLDTDEKVISPETHQADYVPQWSGTADNKTLVEGFPITAAGKAILDDADAAAQLATLGASPSDHNHDDTYYTETELSTPSSGAVVDYTNLANAPAFGSGDGDVVAPATNTDAYVPQWNGADSKELADGFPITDAGKDILADSTISDQRNTLGVDIVGGMISYPKDVIPEAEEELSVFFPYDVTVPTNLAGFVYYASTGPDAEAVVSIQKNGVQFGTMTIAIGSTSAVTLAGTETVLTSSDRLSFVFPTTQDSTWAGVTIMFKGVR